MAIWLYGCMVVLLVLGLAAPVEAVPIDEPTILKYTPPEYEIEFNEAVEAYKEGVVSKQGHEANSIENLLMAGIRAEAGPLEIVQGPDGPVYVRKGGAVNILAGLTGTLYTVQPASSVEYLADLGSNLGLIPAAYAQGFGWHAFSPILGLWKLFRNIAYLAFIVIFVVIGFMIMFRKKIDPQTVISVQNALPKIIVTLILITFSYAIAGFIIDIGQLGSRIIANLLAGPDAFIATEYPEERSKELVDILLQSNTFALVNPLRNVDDLINALATVVDLGLVEPLAWLTVRFAFFTAGFFIMFKIFFALIGPYVAVVLSVIFAPLQLLMDAIPGSTGGLSGWLRNLVANVAVFPVTFAMLAIAAVLKSGQTLAEKCIEFESQAPSLTGLKDAPWCPRSEEFISLWGPTTIGNWGRAAGHLAAFGILFTIPKVVQIVQSALKVEAKPWAAAPAEEIRAGFARIPLVGDFIARRMGS